MHHSMVSMEVSRAPCRSSRVTHSLQALTFPGRMMVLVVLEMAIGS